MSIWTDDCSPQHNTQNANNKSQTMNKETACKISCATMHHTHFIYRFVLCTFVKWENCTFSNCRCLLLLLDLAREAKLIVLNVNAEKKRFRCDVNNKKKGQRKAWIENSTRLAGFARIVDINCLLIFFLQEAWLITRAKGNHAIISSSMLPVCDCWRCFCCLWFLSSSNNSS